MRRAIVAIAVLIASVGGEAQEPRQRLPGDVIREVVDIYNAPGTLKADGRLDISTDQDVRGDVAVVNGPLTIAGHIRGRVVAINADVFLKPGARVDGDMVIVGGVLNDRDDGHIAGEIRIHREALDFSRDGDRLVADERQSADDDDWWDRHMRRRREARSRSRLSLVSAKTYNRVEGLPILFGPTVRHRDGSRRVSLDLYAIVRTTDNLRFESQRAGADLFGHNLRAEVRWGAVGIGAKAYDVMEAVEDWQLTDPEVGLSSFFLHRDYRDYYNRHGAGGFVSLFAGDHADLSIGYSGERWASRSAGDPWTLFRNGEAWRPNPPMENTLVHLATAGLRIDTRNDEDHPTTGWWIRLDYERGIREPDSLTLANFGEGFSKVFDSDERAYNRVFLDFRRYNRIGPNAQINFRVVTGGWAGQDPLPLQRRMSIPGGAGTVPGFDFRRTRAGTADVGTCNTSGTTPLPGSPALCDRIALVQAEYKGDLHIDLFGWDDYDGNWGFDIDHDPNWVVFVDAGRGWLLGNPAEQPATDARIYTPYGALPNLSTFRTDIGVGLEFQGFGMFIAKAVSEQREPLNFFIRLNQRF